jgi:hypothetical protein
LLTDFLVAALLNAEPAAGRETSDLARVDLVDAAGADAESVFLEEAVRAAGFASAVTGAVLALTAFAVAVLAGVLATGFGFVVATDLAFPEIDETASPTFLVTALTALAATSFAMRDVEGEMRGFFFVAADFAGALAAVLGAAAGALRAATVFAGTAALADKALPVLARSPVCLSPAFFAVAIPKSLLLS